jgi:hypothetical protein
MSITEFSNHPAGTHPSLKPVAVPIKTARLLLGGKARSEVYAAIGRGQLVALKDAKKTLVTVASIEAYMASLPPAKIKTRPPQQRSRKRAATA